MAQNMNTLNPMALVFILCSSLCVTTIMDHHNFSYSMKNVPIPSEKQFKIEFLNSIHNLDRRMKWRAFHYLNPQLNNNNKKETFGLNTSLPPQPIKELKEFQTGLCDLAKQLKFRKTTNNFQRKLKDDLRKLSNDDKVIVAADKTRNFYKMEKDNYNELLERNITKDNKKVEEGIVRNITKEDKKVAMDLEIDDRLYCTSKRDCFVTLKDHKQNFMNSPKCRVINPTKSELGKVSKQMLSHIISVVKVKSQLQQWKNTDSVIDRFRKLKQTETALYSI
jgi:hypothetical protein